MAGDGLGGDHDWGPTAAARSQHSALAGKVHRAMASEPSVREAITIQPTVFIGSSSEMLPVVNRLVSLLSNDFRPRPWNQVFTSGDYTFDVLTREVERADAAVFIFGKDDTLGFRGEATYAARDNVILEYGLFAAGIGRDRVLILEEKGVKLPSDLLGIAIDQFPSDEFARNAALDEFATKARKKWPTPRPKPQGEDADGGLGYVRTLRSEREKLQEISRILGAYDRDRRPVHQGPIEFLATAPISTYSEALGSVQSRFWTTTFLSSGFWTRPHGRVMDANERMLARVRAAGGEARRLFLLDQPPGMVAQAYRDHRVLQRQLRKQDELRRLAEEHRHLKENMKRLLAEGFEVRVVFDEENLWESVLPKEILWDPRDSELALYDDFRLDIFEGGSKGVVHGVRTYSKASRYFPAYLTSATQYFERLWARAIDMSDFIEELQEAVALAEAKIDYESNWLAMYEYALAEEDKKLKIVEMERVREILRQEMEQGAVVKRFLDIGTCTARYPIQLRDYVRPDGYILGVDEDYDCVRFAQAQVKRECGEGENRIDISQANFAGRQTQISPPFDLITCMLGTLSHFGWDLKSSRDDSLQRVLERIYGLLAPNGVVFLGTWSEYARKNRNMLGIYRQTDEERLSAWTVTLNELDKRLELAGLEVMGRATPELRLDLTWCRRATG